MSTSQTYPRSVTPGIETQLGQLPGGGNPLEPGVFCTIDWLRGTCPEDRLSELMQFCDDRFGETRRRSSGARHFKRGIEWVGGVQLSWKHNAKIAMLDVRGKWLSSVPFSERLAVFLAMRDFGLRMTRVDLAVDFIGQGNQIYANALASCIREELCILRTFSPTEKYGPGVHPQGLNLTMGKRDSAVCAKIYDKGLEQKCAPAGEWERIEVEFKEHKASLLGSMLVASNKPEALIADLVFGAFDFREKNGRSELKRRPRVAWWSSIVGDLGIRPRASTEPTSFQIWRDAFVNSYGRAILRLSQLLEVDQARLVSLLLSGADASENPLKFEAELESIREVTNKGLGDRGSSKLSR